MEKGELDYLLIPTGWKKQRRKRALKELKNRKIKNIFILNGNDSEEDILYLGKILKKGDKIGIVTFHLHYLEYLEIIKKAIRQKKFPRNVKIENIETKETWNQFIYGFLGLEDEMINHQKVTYSKYRKDGILMSFFKKIIKKFLGSFGN